MLDPQVARSSERQTDVNLLSRLLVATLFAVPEDTTRAALSHELDWTHLRATRRAFFVTSRVAVSTNREFCRPSTHNELLNLSVELCDLGRLALATPKDSRN